MATEAQAQGRAESSESTLQVSVSMVVTWLCVVATLPLLVLGLGRAAPLVLVVALGFYVGGRFGWRNLLARAWHYNDGDAPGAVFLTHVYVVMSCAVGLLLLLQLLAWVWSPATSY